jgi:GNAT superfamily N-acetyltransferase
MTSSAPAIRPMRPGDAAAVVEMAGELAVTVGDPVPELLEADVVRNVSGPRRWCDCFVAEVAEQLVGYATTCRAFEVHTAKKRLWLGDLYVRPAARRNGTGRALMIAIARHGLELGCDAIHWELWRKNTVGATFYRKLMAEELSDIASMRLDSHGLAAIVASQSTP